MNQHNKKLWSRDQLTGLKGYTLIEILIVLFIVSIVATTVLLTIRANEKKQIEAFANEIYQMLSLAQEEAMLLPTIIGIQKNGNQITFLSFSKFNKKRKPVWVPLQSSQLNRLHIRNGIALSIKTPASAQSDGEDDDDDDGDEKKTQGPQIVISTTGDISAFTMLIGKEGDKASYLISSTPDGRLSQKVLT